MFRTTFFLGSKYKVDTARVFSKRDGKYPIVGSSPESLSAIQITRNTAQLHASKEFLDSTIKVGKNILNTKGIDAAIDHFRCSLELE